MFCDNLVWFRLLWVIILVGRHLRRATRQPAPVASTPSQRKTARPLKPHTPNDCPVCGRLHPTPRWGNPRKAGVLPWSEPKKSARKAQDDLYGGVCVRQPGL